jgi:MFS superfamily sulfate permease-like transporter
VSSLFGGLTIIPGGVKSKANIASGGRTLWANFTNALCLIVYLLVAFPIINMIPKAALAAVLIYTGWKMCEPLVWRHMAHIGKEQLGIFAFTVVATLATDLLWGIVAGTIAKLALNLVLYRQGQAATAEEGETLPSYWRSVRRFFANPVQRREIRESEYHLYLNGPLVCFNSMKLSEELDRIPEGATAVSIHLDERVALIDHTSRENLTHSIQEFSNSDVPVNVVGLERMRSLSHYPACTLVAATPIPAVAV